MPRPGLQAEAVFPQFAGWNEDYAAFSVSEEDYETVSDYIKADGERHRTVPFLDEYKQLLTEAGIEFDENELSHLYGRDGRAVGAVVWPMPFHHDVNRRDSL